MKYENTRIVTFKEDYYVKTKDGGKKLLHKKSTSPKDRKAMHKGIVKILQKNGAKIEVENLDAKTLTDKRKQDKLKQEKTAMQIGR